jgi:hypothetical protein
MGQRCVHSGLCAVTAEAREEYVEAMVCWSLWVDGPEVGSMGAELPLDLSSM